MINPANVSQYKGKVQSTPSACFGNLRKRQVIMGIVITGAVLTVALKVFSSSLSELVFFTDQDKFDKSIKLLPTHNAYGNALQKHFEDRITRLPSIDYSNITVKAKNPLVALEMVQELSKLLANFLARRGYRF